QKVREAIERANSLQAELGKVALELGQLIGEEVEPMVAVITSAAAREESESKKLLADDSDEGLRHDIIGYLCGEIELGSVRSFHQKQLVECFRELEKQKDQPAGWRDRFVRVQQANLTGKLS
ncbi:MAG TPA: hypothetical protein VFP32_03395, partial [Candidatus Saccharimonadales bacterium]|nr:hypothetical protein [Candidatus Saccharimonadales bacterium]